MAAPPAPCRPPPRRPGLMAAAVATLALCHGAGTALTLALPGRLIASPLVSAAALDPFALIAAPLRLALVALRGH